MDANALKLTGLTLSAMLGIGVVDPAPFALVSISFLIAIVTGTLGARYAIRVSRQEIAAAFKDHVDKLHAKREQAADAIVDIRSVR